MSDTRPTRPLKKTLENDWDTRKCKLWIGIKKKEGARVLEIANLFLDEPEIEAVLFTKDDHSNENAE